MILAAAIVLVALLARGSTRTGNRGGDHFPPAGTDGGHTRAREILDERYARGELTDQEYLDR